MRLQTSACAHMGRLTEWARCVRLGAASRLTVQSVGDGHAGSIADLQPIRAAQHSIIASAWWRWRRGAAGYAGRLGDVVGMAEHDLRTHRTAVRGLLDTVPWPEGLLEQLPAQAAHTLSLQPEAFFLMKWSTLRTVERHL